MNHSSNSGRRYDREFKINAVALVKGGRTITEVAREPATWAFPNGRSAAGSSRANAGKTHSEPKTLGAETPEQRELRLLRQENDYLRRQRDILKKALGILLAEMPPHLSS